MTCGPEHGRGSVWHYLYKCVAGSSKCTGSPHVLSRNVQGYVELLKYAALDLHNARVRVTLLVPSLRGYGYRNALHP